MYGNNKNNGDNIGKVLAQSRYSITCSYRGDYYGALTKINEIGMIMINM